MTPARRPAVGHAGQTGGNESFATFSGPTENLEKFVVTGQRVKPGETKSQYEARTGVDGGGGGEMRFRMTRPDFGYTDVTDPGAIAELIAGGIKQRTSSSMGEEMAR